MFYYNTFDTTTVSYIFSAEFLFAFLVLPSIGSNVNYAKHHCSINWNDYNQIYKKRFYLQIINICTITL